MQQFDKMNTCSHLDKINNWKLYVHFLQLAKKAKTKRFVPERWYYHQLFFFYFCSPILMISNRTSGWSHFSFDSVSPRSFAIWGASLLMAPGLKMKKCNSFHCCDRGERWWRRWPCWQWLLGLLFTYFLDNIGTVVFIKGENHSWE